MKKLIQILLVCGLVVVMGGSASGETMSAEAKAAWEEFNKAKQGIKPERQKVFLNIILSHAKKYKKAKNQVKKSMYREKRFTALDDYFFVSAMKGRNLNFKHWVGKLVSMRTNKDGDASIKIDIASSKGRFVRKFGRVRLVTGPDVLQSFSILHNVVDDHLISSGTQLYDKLSDMKKGDKVVISGKFHMHADQAISFGFMTTGWYLQSLDAREKATMTFPSFLITVDDINKTN
jgi:hypothetical protein